MGRMCLNKCINLFIPSKNICVSVYLELKSNSKVYTRCTRNGMTQIEAHV